MPTKKYQCPVCKEVVNHSTNHFGEIYTPCKKCKSSILYCIEPEALTELRKRNINKVVFHYYRFDVDNVTEKEKYSKLKEALEEKGYKLWETLSGIPIESWMRELVRYDKEIVNVYDKDTFDNQFISDIGRLHYWCEMKYPNKRIKNGYYIEFQN